MTKNIEARKVGRPTVKTEDKVKLLEDALRIGATTEQAHSYAGISKQTYYDWFNEDEDFHTRMLQAKHYATLKAKNIVVDKIVNDSDLNTAKWWLEKHEEDFKSSMKAGVSVEDEEGKVIKLVLDIPKD